MDTQVLARQWRPSQFEDVIGQAHVVKALSNSLTQGRLHHAWLFTGTRGVGKTTLARILAKALSCEQGISATPCGQCDACVAIEQGRFADVMEVDAASRTKVEDTRDLLDNAQYAPSHGRFKIYIIDEVHMLSAHSFNALLKTLEEPPPHVKFILATTDPQKLPITVTSRCMQFHLKHLSDAEISSQIHIILKQENRQADDAAIASIASAAQGSMRDALSLLDQLLAFCGESLTASDVNQHLGKIDTATLIECLTVIVEQNPTAAFDIIDKIAQTQSDFAQVLADLISLIHQTAIQQTLPSRSSDPQLQTLADLIDPQTLQLYYQIALMGRRDLPLAPNSRVGFEMLMLRLLHFTPLVDEQTAPPPPSTSASKPVAPKPAKPSPAPPPPSSDWESLLSQLTLTGAASALAQHSHLKSHENDVITLQCDPASVALATPDVTARLTKALSDHFQKTIKVDIVPEKPNQVTPAGRAKQVLEDKQAKAKKAITQDSNVQAILSEFDAKIADDTIQER